MTRNNKPDLDSGMLYQLLYENSRDIILIIRERDGQILEANISAQNAYQYSLEELLSMTIYDLRSSDTHQEVTAQMAKAMSSGLLFETYHRRKNGEIFPVEVSSQGTLMKDLAVLVSSIRDITERKRTVELLRETESRFRAFVEQAPIAIGVFHLDGSGLYANQKFIEILGLQSVENVVGQPAFEYFSPQFREASKERTRRRLLGLPVPAEYESTLLRADGTEFPVSVAVAPIQLSEETVSIAFLTDITERKQMEEALRESEKKYHNMFDNAIEGIFQTTPEGRYSVINQAFASMAGYGSPEEMQSDITNIGEQLYVNPEDRKRLLMLLQASEGTVREFETQVRRKDGTLFWISTNVRMVHNKDEKTTWLEGTCIDITERKHAEKALQDSEQRFHQLADATFEGVAITEDGRILDVNRSLLEMLRYEKFEELLGKSAIELTPLEYREIVKTHMVAGHEEPYESMLTRKDGTTFSVEVHGKMMEMAGRRVRITAIRDITERKQAESALRESEENYRSLFENASIGIFHSLPKGRFLRVNRALSQMFGYVSPDDMIAAITNIDNQIYVDSKQRSILLDRTLEQADWVYAENRYRRKDGTILTANLSVRKILNADGTVAYLEGFVEDITERKQADETLRESAAKFRAIIDVSPIPYALNDDKGNITFLNKAFTSVFGYTLEEIPTLNEWWPKAYPNPEYCQWVATTWQAHLERAKQESAAFEPIEVTIQCKEGAVRTAMASAVSLGESFEGIHLVILHDITDRKQLEEDLLKRKQQYDNLVANVPVGVYIMRSTPSGAFAFEYVSPKVSETFNVTTENFLADPQVGFRPIHPDDLESLVKLNQEVFKQPRPFNWEGRAVIDGTVKWLNISSTPEQLTDGDVLWHGVVADITERKQTEEALAKIEKLEAIGTLAAGIAHDFNNLLGVMFGYLELSQMEAEKTYQKEIASYLAQARNAFDRAKDLTGQLLTFSKGGAPVRKTQSLPEHVRRTISFSLSGSQLALEFSIPGDIWLSDFDEHQVAQVLDNMVINARQAMPQGGVLNVSIRNITASEAPTMLPPEDYVCVSIRDHGTGIAPEHLPHIFDPFFTTKKMGSGLGLATSYSIIRQHDGLIDVDSVVGKGTTFHIYLPASSGSAIAVADDKPKTHQGNGGILIMDDEDMILDMLALMLENMGYQVVKTRHGKEAKETMREALLAGKHFIAAILDLTIPSGLGGKDTVYALLALDPTIKVIASSGYANDPIICNPADFGFAGRLTKPYRRSDLSTVLSSVLAESK